MTDAIDDLNACIVGGRVIGEPRSYDIPGKKESTSFLIENCQNGGNDNLFINRFLCTVNHRLAKAALDTIKIMDRVTVSGKMRTSVKKMDQSGEYYPYSISVETMELNGKPLECMDNDKYTKKVSEIYADN